MPVMLVLRHKANGDEQTVQRDGVLLTVRDAAHGDTAQLVLAVEGMDDRAKSDLDVILGAKLGAERHLARQMVKVL